MSTQMAAPGKASMFGFGCSVPEGVKPRIYFGFRAIHQPHRGEYMALLHDRKSLKGEPDTAEKAVMNDLLDEMTQYSKDNTLVDGKVITFNKESEDVGTVYSCGYFSSGYFHGAIYIPEKYRVIDREDDSGIEVNVYQIVDEINRDRSEDWEDVTPANWQEGLSETQWELVPGQLNV